MWTPSPSPKHTVSKENILSEEHITLPSLQTSLADEGQHRPADTWKVHQHLHTARVVYIRSRLYVQARLYLAIPSTNWLHRLHTRVAVLILPLLRPETYFQAQSTPDSARALAAHQDHVGAAAQHKLTPFTQPSAAASSAASATATENTWCTLRQVLSAAR